MSFIVGETAISTMLEPVSTDQKHAAVAKSNQHDLVAERIEVALLHHQDSQQAEKFK